MQSVKIVECPRDAWQGLKRQIPTARKVEYLRALIDAGFRHIDAVSFVSSKAVPQMADSEAVLKQLSPPPEVEVIGIVVNEKGADRAIATNAVRTLGYPCSISETFLRRNQNQSIQENLTTLERIKRHADRAGLEMVAYISMAFGNPYGDPWDEEKIADAAKTIAGVGIRAVSLADTVGASAPALIQRVITVVLRQMGGECVIGIHLHSAPGEAASKILAAYDAGCRQFDSALGGLGGCPFAQDQLVGNVPTEEVLQALRQRQCDIPLNLSLAAAVNAAIATEFSECR